MPQFSTNKYLQSKLEDLITTYETEVNYTPINIELDSQQIAPNDIEVLLRFVSDTRKRLFLFKIPNEMHESAKLALVARRSLLNQTASKLLQNTSHTAKIDPLKKELGKHPSSVRARIQIQKKIILPKPSDTPKNQEHKHDESVTENEIKLVPYDFLDGNLLHKQLEALKVKQVHDLAALKIQAHLYAFKDGIIPDNLIAGFYIEEIEGVRALCYSDTLKKRPTALAPVLKKQEQLNLPSTELTTELLRFAGVAKPITSQLLSANPNETEPFLRLFPNHKHELNALFSHTPPTFILPILYQHFIFGGNFHTLLLVRLLNTCFTKKINIGFLNNPTVQNSLLNPRGIKNLQKLVQLTAEQKEWWNTLVTAHLDYDENSFDFDAFFEAYTQIFLPRIAEKKLTLPNPCPILHCGHMLITLNRVLDVIEHAQNPQEQCLSLSGLDWGPTGVHFAMTQKGSSNPLKQVAACMQVKNPEDILTSPELIHPHLERDEFQLSPWLFRYMAQHWKETIRLPDIQAQLDEIKKLDDWTSIQKNQLTFILTCTFVDKNLINPEQWKKTLHTCIRSLKPLQAAERSDLLHMLSRCFKFKPKPSLAQISTLINQCIELKKAFPTEHFSQEHLIPLASCLEREGFALLDTLQERAQKTLPAPGQEQQFSLFLLASFTAMLHRKRPLSHDLTLLLAKLNESEDEVHHQERNADQIIATLNILHQKNKHLHPLVLNILSQINIAKSQPLPDKERIQRFIERLVAADLVIPPQYGTQEQQETWFLNFIIEENCLPGCVFGNGTISKLDGLIVDALMDAVTKRGSAFDINALKEVLQEYLKSFLVPKQLREQLDRELMPLLDAFIDLIKLLQSSTPHFSEVLTQLKLFEEKKPILLEGTYRVTGMGETKGKYILSLLLTGKKKMGCSLHVVSQLPHDLTPYKESYLFLKNNAQKQLYYIDLDGTVEEVPITHLNQFEHTLNGMKQQKKTVVYLSGDQVKSLITSNGNHTPRNADNTTSMRFELLLKNVYSLLAARVNGFFADPQNQSAIKDLNAETALSWMATFNQTHTLTFFFEEELVHKKIIPALQTKLQQLNTGDPEFERSILNAASQLGENEPAHILLHTYKNTVETITKHLNLLIDIKDISSYANFEKIYKQLNTRALARLSYAQKNTLLSGLMHQRSLDTLQSYLELASQILDENPDAMSTDIERAIHGLMELFTLETLDPETQIMFFKMSMTHNLNSTSPFPLSALNELKKSNLSNESKPLIIEQIIRILIGLSNASSDSAQDPSATRLDLGQDLADESFTPQQVSLDQSLVLQTQSFLMDHPEQDQLCIALLKRISQHNTIQEDLGVYSEILQLLTQLDVKKKSLITLILTQLANNKKDLTVNLPALREIAKGLNRSLKDIQKVVHLFTTTPYPSAESLNTVLFANDSYKLDHYCSHFDTNPFAKPGEKRKLNEQFTSNRIKDALLNVRDLMHETLLPHTLQIKLAKQLVFIETLGYTENPTDFSTLKPLTRISRTELKQDAHNLIQQLRTHSIDPEHLEVTQLKLIAYLREIYFRTTGLFPNTTQILVLLLALQDPSVNLLMRIKTGEGKSINAPMLSVLQYTQGGCTVIQFTANPTLLARDFEHNCEPFYKFLGIKTALIQSNTPIEAYQLDGINCSTVEDMSLFRLTAKEMKQDHLLENDAPIHIVLDECDDALLDQTTLYNLVADAEDASQDNPAQWIYPLVYEFIRTPNYRNTNPTQGTVWDEEDDPEQLRLFINTRINNQFEKQNHLMKCSNTQLKQWIYASIVAETLVENKDFILQALREQDTADQKMICVPLRRSIPKPGSILTDGIHQALQARLKIECLENKQYYVIDAAPSVLASQSAYGLIQFCQKTQGRLIGISATLGEERELKHLATQLGTQAMSIAPYAGDQRTNHPPLFTSNRAERTKAILDTLDNIKRPVVKKAVLHFTPYSQVPIHEQSETKKERDDASDAWSHTQTQPILIICEGFDEAQAMGAHLKSYQKQGFTIQIITGKESPDELNRIITQAGEVNTITLGTTMLTRGIDIDTKRHPKGLFVIQTYADTERMTTQIAGRAARNGKPGEWLPIYQIEPPGDLFSKIMYFIFPWRRQQMNEQTIEILRNKLKMQASRDRIYTQAIAEVQQTLMQQIEAWDSFLLELYPHDLKMQCQFYRWREALFNELARSQETCVCEHSLNENISKFKKLACKLWESAREEQWAEHAKKVAKPLNEEQKLRFKYLTHLDLAQELLIQKPLRQKIKKWTAATDALVQQNLETFIENKAGAVLEYTKPLGEEKEALELMQCKQLLPGLIGRFCSVYPDALPILFPKDSQRTSFFVPIPRIVRSMVQMLIEQKNKILPKQEKHKLSQSIIHYYQTKLMQSTSNEIQEILSQIKPLMDRYCDELTHLSLIQQFKMQGLILNFCTLYQNSGLPEDAELMQFQANYQHKMIQKLAQHLATQLAWVNEKPKPIHVIFEREVAKSAALAIHKLAKAVIATPENQEKIHKLYAGLQQHKAILKDHYLFSIGHPSPRNTINQALEAIDSLTGLADCDLEFREKCHDKVIAKHQITAFHHYLHNTSPYFFNTSDPIWDHLKTSLLNISRLSDDNPQHGIQELYLAVERFSTYAAYKPYLEQLKGLKKQLQHSRNLLNGTDGLKQNNAEESLLAQKTTQFAALLGVENDKVRIQSGSNGIESYIELQVENAPLDAELIGYRSPILAQMETDQDEYRRKKAVLTMNQHALVDLPNDYPVDHFPQSLRAEFRTLLQLKNLLNQDWNHHEINREELPLPTQNKLSEIDMLKQWNWIEPSVDFLQVRTIMSKHEERFPITHLIQEQTEQQQELELIQEKIKNTRTQIMATSNEIENIDHTIRMAHVQIQQPDCSLRTKSRLYAQIAYNACQVAYQQHQLSLAKKQVQQLAEEEQTTQEELKKVNQSLDAQRTGLIVHLLEQTKYELTTHLSTMQKNMQQRMDIREKKIRTTNDSLDRMVNAEHEKSRYYTRRFFNSKQLLSYEARLSHEEERIPTSLALVEQSSSQLDQVINLSH